MSTNIRRWRRRRSLAGVHVKPMTTKTLYWRKYRMLRMNIRFYHSLEMRMFQRAISSNRTDVLMILLANSCTDYVTAKMMNAAARTDHE